MFETRHWSELVRDGYTVVSGAIEPRLLHAAQEAASALAALHPGGDWERSKDESWREIRHCAHPAFGAIVHAALDPLTAEILDSAPPLEPVQLAATMPGFAPRARIGRAFHVDGGSGPALGVFNVLLGVALTPVDSDTSGGFHVWPGSHARLAALFARLPVDQPVHWGEAKLAGQKTLRPEARMVVPRLAAGDIVVAHSFIAHGTSANTTDVRRDMIFQRRAAAPLWDPSTQGAARTRFMRDPWAFFRLPV
ncbi:MAG: phytanoyl-CoA dioxygenase family protein [Alphaproteobacteria bacterium]|nr:phytanoyl-CoA dioxygenase family protein [Alphaproteobacteria bacterium]MCW5741307.1 phytanoyl-CoA dioxygenase family protein [Alphaproteobacteria bacterium]